MQMEFLPPSPALSALVAFYYFYRSDDLEITGVMRADLGQIRFLMRGSGELSFPDGRTDTLCPITVYGAGTAAASYRVDGPLYCFGIALRPMGWYAVTGIPAHARVDRVTDGEGVFLRSGPAMLEALRGVRTIEEMFPLGERFVADQARPVPVEHQRVCQAIARWLTSGEGNVQSLFLTIPMSPRHVVRLANQYFGAPPKLLERKFRALRAAKALVQGEEPRAVAEAFYDQPHMNREIRRFTGHTPGTLAVKADQLFTMLLLNGSFNQVDMPEPA